MGSTRDFSPNGKGIEDARVINELNLVTILAVLCEEGLKDKRNLPQGNFNYLKSIQFICDTWLEEIDHCRNLSRLNGLRARIDEKKTVKALSEVSQKIRGVYNELCR